MALGSLMVAGIAFPRYLSLFRNAVTDDGAATLASLLALQTYTVSLGIRAMQELHLSHNRLTEWGVETLVSAAQQSVYPYAVGAGKTPLWLRIEYNSVDLRRISLAPALHCTCTAASGCKTHQCSRRPVPPVHLPHLDKQNRDRAYGAGRQW